MAAAPLLLLLLWPAVGGHVIRFSIPKSGPLHAIAQFGVSGGANADVALSIAPQSCPAQSPCPWHELDQVFLAVLDTTQWVNLSRVVTALGPPSRLDDPIAAASNDATFDCAQLAAARTQLSLTAWRENAVAAPGGGGAERGVAVLGLAAGPSAAPASPAPTVEPSPRDGLRFWVRFELPPRAGIYTVALFNCRAALVSMYAEVFVTGLGGEELSEADWRVVVVRIIVFSLASGAALLVLALMAYHRAVAVPLQGMLAGVLLLRGAQQAVMLYATLNAPRSGALSRAATSSPAAAAAAHQLSAFTVVQADAEVWGHYGRLATLLAEACSHVSSLLFFGVLVAFCAGLHFSAPVLPPREREVVLAALSLYLLFGMMQPGTPASDDLSRGVFVLSYNVVKILVVFGVLLFLNASYERLRRATGHEWAVLRADIVRAGLLKAIRLRLLLVYLVLPIVFMFLEVVLDWQAEWFKVLWREWIELYAIFYVAATLHPSAETYSVHFVPLRTPPNVVPAGGIYASTFRWLIGSRVDVARAEAYVEVQRSHRSGRARPHPD